MKLPSQLPRPPGEEAQLKQIWCAPRGREYLWAVNNTYVGIYYVATAFLFFLLAGVLALIMRTQLAVPENTLVSPGTYNQIFTMHGTIMMFLFAVPAVEAMGVYLLPNMLGARDLPFPRLSAYAFWAYAVGGTVFFLSLFFKVAPDGGWFMYPPYTSYPYSPGVNSDFWLLGIGFIEISAIAGAVEIIVGILRTRAPGMTLDKMPIYAWSMLVFAFMIVFAFPAMILCTALLELERAFYWPFFLAERGGDPLLWQHLFWFFGHPEVYIIFLPAAGMVSMIVATMARRALVGYKLIVLALVGTAFLSFGLWVHHMFTTGIPRMSLSFFSAASMAVAVPSGIQVFAWIATIASGRMRLTTPALFILGFLFIFVLGGLTGVMVAAVPFDWQVHDSYFIVAHLHYVLVGGMVFPLFAAFYYWIPTASTRPLSERLGRWVAGLFFVGFNVTFFPMHLTGLWGMPRRVYTYPAGQGWDTLNLVSTAGAYLMAIAVLLFLYDLCRNFRPFKETNAGNVWGASTLEWLPSDTYGVRSIPQINTRDPLWEQPNLAEDVGAGGYYLPDAPTGGRETIVTSPVSATPQYVQRMPGPSWSHFAAAIFTAAFFLLLTVKIVVPALICGVLAIAFTMSWLWWGSDLGETHPPVDVGGNLKLPVYQTGSCAHSWWGTVVLLLVCATLFAALVFAYLFLWTVSPHYWPYPSRLPAPIWPIASLVLFAGSSLLLSRAGRALAANRLKPLCLWILAGLLAAAAGFGAMLAGQWLTGLRAPESAYAAVVYTFVALTGVFVFTQVLMGLYTVARAVAGKLDARRRVTFDNTMLFWHYTTGQALITLAILHLLPYFLR